MFELVLTEYQNGRVLRPSYQIDEIDRVKGARIGRSEVTSQCIDLSLISEMAEQRSADTDYHYLKLPGSISSFVDLVLTYKEVIAYTAGSMTAFGVFVRNVVGTVKDWQDIGAKSRSRRTVHLKLDGKLIEVRDGDDLVGILEKHWPGPKKN